MMLRTSLTAASAITAASLALSPAAHAAPLSAAEVLAVFNGATQGNFTTTIESEGRVYVGGNLSGGTFQIGFNGGVVPSDFDELIVVGNSSMATINAQNGSDVTIGGSATGTIELNGGPQGTRTARIGGTFAGTANQGTVLTGQALEDPNFADRFPNIDFDALTTEAMFFSTLAGAGFGGDMNNRQIIGAPDGSGLSVHNVSLSELATGGYSFDLNGATTVLINVSGTTGSFGLNPLGGTPALAENVVWNFFEATSLNVSTLFVGSVLAPLADITGFNGNLEGSVIAKSINLLGEMHSRPFAGTLPSQGVPPTTPIPLPAGLPLLLAGLGGLALLRRRS